MLWIDTLEVTPFAQNARVLWDEGTGDAVIVDPGGDLERIFAVVDQRQPARLDIWLTHAHLDHAGGVARCLQMAFARVSQVPRLFAHSEPLLRGLLQQQAKHYHLPVADYQNVPDPDVIVGDGDVLRVGSYAAQAFFTPGHAPDHLSFYFTPDHTQLGDEDGNIRSITAPVLIAGDALFQGSIGRTDLPGGSLPLLLKSIHEKLLVLPPDTVVLCGHGPNTTIAAEAQFNPFLQDA